MPDRNFATLHYPHEADARAVATLNRGNGVFRKMRELDSVTESYGIQFSFNFTLSPEQEKAVKYFEGQVYGGHSMAVVGFDDTRRMFTIRNSWGAGVGDNGYFYMSYDFFNAETRNPFRPRRSWVGEMVAVTGVEV